MIFTSDAGEQYGYKDGWTEDGLFNYTGEGQVGDMQFKMGNKAIRDHSRNGKAIHLFKYVSTGLVMYLGQVICTGYHTRTSLDRNNDDRQAIVFELTPIERFNLEIAPEDI